MQEYGTEVQKIKRSYKPGLSCLLITCPLGHGASTTWFCLFGNSVLHSWRIPYPPFKIFQLTLKKRIPLLGCRRHLKQYLLTSYWSQLSNIALEQKCLSIRGPSYWIWVFTRDSYSLFLCSCLLTLWNSILIS